jgi:hypothetical protein
MADRLPLFTDVYETDTFNEWRLKTNSIKVNLTGIYDYLDNINDIVVTLTGDQTVSGTKTFTKKSIWTQEYTRNEVTPMLELKVTNSNVPFTSSGHSGSGPSIDFYNPDTTGAEKGVFDETGDVNSWLSSRIASITEKTDDRVPDASLVFYTGVNLQPIVEKMRITSDGNVGIGTSDPQTLLSIVNNTDAPELSIIGPKNSHAGIQFGDSDKNDSGKIRYLNPQDAMVFHAGSGNSSAERLRITRSGNIGIATNSPTQKLDVVGNIVSSGWIESGRETGGVALTTNDGHGNAAVAFNHNSGKPTVDGSSGRIRCEVDNTTARMSFRLLDSVVANSSPYDLDEILALTIAKVSLLKDTDIDGELYTTGKIGIRIEDPDWDLCVGNKQVDVGHVALDGDAGTISLRPTANSTHRWLLNTQNSAGGTFSITSSKWNGQSGTYTNTPILKFYNNGKMLSSGSLGLGGGNLAGGVKLDVKGASDNSISAKFRGGIQVNQYDGATRAYGFLTTSQQDTLIGGNLKLTGEQDSDIGKEATVYIVCDDQYKLYHNENLIGTGVDWRIAGKHTFTITGNDRIGVEAINTGGPHGLAFVIKIGERIIVTSNKTDVKASFSTDGGYAPNWNVDYNFFNVLGTTPIDGTYANVVPTLAAMDGGIDIGNAIGIWGDSVSNGNLIGVPYYFQTRIQEVASTSYGKGTNHRGAAAIKFINGSNSTGQITFLRATDTNDALYTVFENARFDENGRLGIGLTNPTHLLHVDGSVRSNDKFIVTGNDTGLPQLTFCNNDLVSKKFSISRDTVGDTLRIGPENASGVIVPAIEIGRDAKVSFSKGISYTMPTELVDTTLVNKKYVDDVTGGLLNEVHNHTGYQAIEGRDFVGTDFPTTVKHFVSTFTTTHENDGGGILIDVTDTNEDEHAISVYNTHTNIDKPIFVVKATNGDTDIRGKLEVADDLTSKGRSINLPDITGSDTWTIKKNSGNLQFNRKNGATTKSVMTLKPSGVALQADGINNNELITKEYVDKTFAAVNNTNTTTFPRFAVATGTAAVKSDYTANTAFSFDIKALTGLSTADADRVYAVDATIHNFQASSADYNTSYKYPDSVYREVQGSKGYNSDDDNGGSAQVLLPVSGSYVTFKSNTSGTTRARSQRKVVINGFWYYNAIATPVTTSTATTSTTSTAIPTLPAVDSFDVRIKTFNQILAGFFTNGLVRNTTHSISRYISGLSNDRLADELLVDDGLYSGYRPPNYIVVGTSRTDSGYTDEFTDSEIAALTEWVRTGGTLFICGEYRSSPTDAFYNYKVDKIIEELGGVGWSRTTGIDPDWYFSWQRMAGSLPQSSYVQTTQEAIDLGIVLDMNDSLYPTARRMYTSGARRIHNPASKGVPLLPAPKDGSLFTYISGLSDPGDPYESIIHMWDGKLGHLDPGVTGKIIWLGDTQQTIDNDRALEESIITPLITYIEKQKIQ